MKYSRNETEMSMSREPCKTPKATDFRRAVHEGTCCRMSFSIEVHQTDFLLVKPAVGSFKQYVRVVLRSKFHKNWDGAPKILDENC
jgi:hypothetical protein